LYLYCSNIAKQEHEILLSYGVAMDRNQFRTVTYTEEISTSDIISRILDRGDELRKKKETNRLTKERNNYVFIIVRKIKLKEVGRNCVHQVYLHVQILVLYI